MESNERRQYSRIAFHSPATLVVASGVLDCLVIDLSLKGALVEIPPGIALSLGQEATLRVHLNEIDKIVMDATVAHSEELRVGLLCSKIDLDSVTHLRRLVELNLGQPDLLERELAALIAHGHPA